MPDDHSEVVPLLPIPNRTVKRLSADDSAGSRVKVGHRQALTATKSPTSNGWAFCFGPTPSPTLPLRPSAPAAGLLRGTARAPLIRRNSFLGASCLEAVSPQEGKQPCLRRVKPARTSRCVCEFLPDLGHCPRVGGQLGAERQHSRMNIGFLANCWRVAELSGYRAENLLSADA
jgi:hypothetical protein